MKDKTIIIWLAILLLVLAGCEKEKNGMEITAVSYSSDSGPVSPEMQWHEEILITPEKALLTRNGKTPASMVNAGSWDGRMDKTQMEDFFKQLEAVDCFAMRRIEPEDIPDGGGTTAYTIRYANGKNCELLFNPGVSYIDSSGMIKFITDFIKTIDFPHEALIQIKL